MNETVKDRLPAAAVALLVAATLAYALRGSLDVPLAPAVTGPGMTAAAPSPPPAAVRTIAVKERNGATRNLAAPTDRILVVHFWATWCAPCVEEFPGLVAAWRKLGKRKDIELVTVSVDDAFKTVDPWLAQRKASDIPTYLDPTKSAAKTFGTEKFPETWVLAPDGTVLAHVAGPMDWSNPGVIRQLEEFASALPKKA